MSKKILQVDELLCNISSCLGVVFDLDGTILDSMQMWEELDRNYLNRFGIVIDESLHEEIKSMTLPMAAAYFKEKFNLPRDVDTIIKDIMEMADNSYRNELPLKENAGYILKELHNQGKKIVIATANELELVEHVLKRTGIDGYVDGCITCAMVGSNKEKPDIYYKACELMNISKYACVVFEDSLYAIKTAKNADFYTIGVYDKAEESNWESICEITNCQVVL